MRAFTGLTAHSGFANREQSLRPCGFRAQKLGKTTYPHNHQDWNRASYTTNLATVV